MSTPPPRSARRSTRLPEAGELAWLRWAHVPQALATSHEVSTAEIETDGHDPIPAGADLEGREIPRALRLQFEEMLEVQAARIQPRLEPRLRQLE